MQKLFLILIFKVFFTKANENEKECYLQKNKAIITKNEIYFSNFDNLNELKIDCMTEINIKVLAFQPNKPIILDDSLEIKNLKTISKILDIELYSFMELI